MGAHSHLIFEPDHDADLEDRMRMCATALGHFQLGLTAPDGGVGVC